MNRFSLKRAVAGYDPEFRQRLAGENMGAIVRESLIEGPTRILVIRTTESADALADVLISILAMVTKFDTPSELRKAADVLRARVRRDVAQARAEGAADILGASRWEGTA